MSHRSLAIIGLSLLLVVPGLAGDGIDVETARILDRIALEMEKATMDGQFKTLVSFYAEDCVVMPDFQPPIRGRQALRRIYGENEKTGLVYHAFDGTVEERWASGGKIYERGSFGMTVSNKPHAQPRGYFGSYFQIWERQGDSYKLEFVIWNLDHAPH